MTEKSEKIKKAKSSYNKKTYDNLVLLVRKDDLINGDVIRRYAEQKNVSLNTLVKIALTEMFVKEGILTD